MIKARRAEERGETESVRRARRFRFRSRERTSKFRRDFCIQLLLSPSTSSSHQNFFFPSSSLLILFQPGGRLHCDYLLVLLSFKEQEKSDHLCGVFSPPPPPSVSSSSSCSCCLVKLLAHVTSEPTMEAKMHMKEWLIAQIESGKYEGLCWEDEAKTMFRIPWKHAAKKDYKQTADAALFKAWAVYKGKYREGRDKADPTMWKTRLRCALNKSTDFQEVPERNQLDITEPYKVYLIHYDNAPPRPAEPPHTKDQPIIHTKMSPKSLESLDKQQHCQKESFQASKEEDEEKPQTGDLMREHMYCELTGKKPQNPAPVTFISPSLTISDFRMQVVLLYYGQKVMKVTTRSPDGCFILQGCVPLGNERIYGPCTAEQLSFPSPSSVSLPSCMAEAMNRLLCHLERGVLLWVAPDGVFIKRFCQGRVYWSGPMAQHTDQPNKLEREKTFKLLDMPTFLSEVQSCVQGKGPTPSYKIELCFGEEYPDPDVPKTKKLIMAQVVPLFAVELLQRLNLGEVEEKRPLLTCNREGEKI